MGLTLLLVSGAVVAVAAASVMTTHPEGEVILAGEGTAVGLGDAASETLSGGTAPPPGPAWHLATVGTLADAELLLDYLENQGFGERELHVLGNSCFAVRWR